MIYKTFEQWKSGNVLEHGVSRTEHYSEDQLDLVEMGWMYGYDAGRAVEQALDKKAENARELGLDYEPADGTQVSKVWWDGEKLMAKPIPLVDFYQPAPVQPVQEHSYETLWHKAWPDSGSFVRASADDLKKFAKAVSTPPAQPAPVQEPPDNKYNAKRIAWELERTAMGDGYYGNALYVAMDMPQTTKNDREMLHRYMCGSNLKTDHVKLQDLAMRIYTTPPAPQPAVPDAIHHTDLSEHSQYIEGWNDCRAEMLKGMK
jgi:hypothetical protein